VHERKGRQVEICVGYCLLVGLAGRHGGHRG
jgi:hypothetical protein